MIRNRAKLAVIVGVTVASVIGAAAVASASIGPNKTVKAALKSGTKMTFKGDIDSVPLVVSCTKFSGSGKTGSKPATTFDLSKPPTLSGCTDSLGGTDTVTTNDTNGKWTLSATDTTATLTIPKAGATFTSSVENGCTITAAPSGPVKVKGKYNGDNTITDTGASIATSGSGCTSTTAKESATVVLTPAPGKPPWG